MQPRTYALALAAFAFGLFIAVGAANLVIDPIGVLGTKLLSGSVNGNQRYAKFENYMSQSQRYGALAFGSSRLTAIPLDELSRHLGGLRFADFGVTGGMLTDHLAVLDYVLRQRTRIRTVFILLDADLFGRRPFTDESLAFALPPALSGENPVRFWWRNATAIQFRVWGSALREYSAPKESNGPQNAGTEFAPSDEIERVTQRPLYPQHLELWRKFVALCRQNDIDLVVAISPLSRNFASRLDPADLSVAISDVARLAPVWDFTGDTWVSSDPGLWQDPSHFRTEVGRRIVGRMFGDEVPRQWSNFGQLRDLGKSAFRGIPRK